MGELSRMNAELGGDLGEGEILLEQLTDDLGFECGSEGLFHADDSI